MNLFIPLFFALLMFASVVSARVVDYGSGNYSELISRNDNLAIIFRSSISENEVKLLLSKYTVPGDKISRLEDRIYLLTFDAGKNEQDVERLRVAIKEKEEAVKTVERSFYGSSKKVIQVASDRMIVKLRLESDRNKLEIINAQLGCVTKGNINGSNGFLIETKSTTSSNTLDLIGQYIAKGIFEYVQPDFIYPQGKLLLSIPNDPGFTIQWALHNTGQSIQTGSPFSSFGDAPMVNGIPDADMDLPEAWDLTTGSPNIKIGIIDSGIDSSHADLQSPEHLLSGYDAFHNSEGSSVDVFQHGTSVAGLAGAVMNNSIGIAGVAPGCRLMSICIFDINGTTSTSVITRAFDTAVARGLDVLTNSWGGGQPEPAVTDAINNAAANGRGGLGCAIFFASGNDGRNPPLYPAVLPNVLCIGSSTTHDQVKSPGTGNQFFWGSNYGENQTGDLDMIAPTNCNTISVGGYEQNFWGSSASCPQAAGVAALILSANNQLSRHQVYDYLARGCDKPDNVVYGTQKIFGKWNCYYGYGRINAYSSVMLALNMDVVPPTIEHRNVASHSLTYPTKISAVITDHDGGPVPSAGSGSPKIHYSVKKGNGNWSAFDSSDAVSVNGNTFGFQVPSLGWESQVKYYITAQDNSDNRAEFPKHCNEYDGYCYFAVGSIGSETRKLPAFSGTDFGGTLSPAVNFNSFKILDAKININMRHTFLGEEMFQIYAPVTDPNYNRKCLFSTNGNDGDNILNASVSDSASSFWNSGSPPYTNGHFRPEYSLRGLRGKEAGGAWRVIHFDGGLGDYAFFDSVKITLYKTTGAKSGCARLNSPDDSVLRFTEFEFPGIYEKDFYLKNSGTTGLTLGACNFSGQSAAMYSVTNTPSSSITAGDSALFRVRLNTTVGSSDVSQAILNIPTNDPSKPVFKVSMVTGDSLVSGQKNLQLSAIIEGFYDSLTNLTRPDTVTVMLRSSVAPFNIIDISKARVDSLGRGSFNFVNVSGSAPYYIVLVHRNALETWSSVPVMFQGLQASYDFTANANSAYGNNLIKLGSTYCLYSGDINSDSSIDGTDVLVADNLARNYSFGYLNADVNGDGYVDASDMEITANNSQRYVSVISP